MCGILGFKRVLCIYRLTSASLDSYVDRLYTYVANNQQSKNIRRDFIDTFYTNGSVVTNIQKKFVWDNL